MRYIRRYLLISLLTALLVAGSLSAGSVAFAKSARWTKNQMTRNRSQRDKLYESIKALSKSEKKLSAVLNGYDGQIEKMEADIKKIQDQRSAAEQDLSQMEQRRGNLELALTQTQDNLGARVRAMYMQNDLTYIDVLFQSASVGDLIDRMIYLQAIHQHDKTMIEDIRQKRIDLQTQLTQQNQLITAIEQIKQDLLKQQDQLEQKRGDKKLDLEAIRTDKLLAQRQISELEQENKRIAAFFRTLGRGGGGYQGKAWSGSFKKPCGGTITSGFGMRFHPILHVMKMHTGVDISCASGTTITAAGDGKVVFADWRGGYGKCVMIDHGGGRSTLYGHMSRICCSVGDIVSSKTKIGEVGSTGFSTGPHCHFEVRINGDPVNPLQSLD
jgi:murein DD-endopeptidase MepM/ murein hydrolase activator NlpD